MPIRLRTLSLLPVLVVSCAFAAVPEEFHEMPTRGGVQRFLYLQPAAPVANVVVLPGGNGVLKLRPDGTGDTFLLESSAPSRERQRLAAQGFAVAVVDAPSNWQDGVGLNPYRQSPLHLDDVRAVIGYMRARADLPVWLLGHSNGAESAFFVARNLPPEQPAGAILSAGPFERLRSMDPRGFARPVLIVSHAQDQCIFLAGLNRLYDELVAAPARDHITLTGGDASGGTECTAGFHQFEGLSADYVAAIAGFVKTYNALVAPPPVTLTAVEYYHAGFDHYFLTWVEAEIAKLDAGTEIRGWVRTGASIRVWRDAQPGTSPVCRFYIPPAQGDSHFYGRGTAECDATAAANPSFALEDPAFMHMVLPAAGTCPAGTMPVYRVFSNRADANHRYMTDRAQRGAMAAKGWLAEGDGDDLVVMCGPG